MLKLTVLIFTSFALAPASHVRAQTSGAGSAPTDPQIAIIAVTGGSVNIDAGRLALEKSSNLKVKEFAQLIVTNYTSLNSQATALAKKLGVTPEESETSRSLKASGDKEIAKLKGMSGVEFDTAYVDDEVSYHETMMSALDQTLIPNAQNPELKILLESARLIVVSHLDHAKELHASRLP